MLFPHINDIRIMYHDAGTLCNKEPVFIACTFVFAFLVPRIHVFEDSEKELTEIAADGCSQMTETYI